MSAFTNWIIFKRKYGWYFRCTYRGGFNKAYERGRGEWADNSVWTIKKILIWTTGYFEKHGIDSARLDAELLLSHVLGKSRIYLYTEFERILAAKELALLKNIYKRGLKDFLLLLSLAKKNSWG